MSFKERVKKLLPVYRTYKVLKKLPGTSPSRLLQIRTLHRIWRVIPNTMLSPTRLFNASDCVEVVNKEGLEGDLVECGAWSGGCVGLMALTDLAAGANRRYHLFDSFEGLPQPSAEDGEHAKGFQAKHQDLSLRDVDKEPEELVAIGACVGANKPEVERFLTSTLGIPQDRLKFHVGWFQETVPASREEIEKIAVLRLDGDFYESTLVCLESLYDRVVPGGFVIFDDYGRFSGCKTAVDEFREARALTSELTFVDDSCCYFRVPA